MDTPPSGGRTRTYGLRVDAEGPGSDTPESKGTSLILSHNGASGDTPESSGMIPNRSTSGAAEGETPDAVTPESSGMIPKRSTSGAVQGETPDAVTTRLGMPKLAVAARQIICLRVCSGKASEAPERISPW